MQLAELDNQTRNLLSAYLRHITRRRENLCVYRDDMACKEEEKYHCLRDTHYVQVYNEVKALLIRNPELGAEVITGKPQIPTETLISIVTKDNATIKIGTENST